MMQNNTRDITQNIEQDYLQMPYNKYLWLRLEFVALCGDELEALIMRALEYEIEGDRRIWMRKITDLVQQGKEAPKEPDQWWVTLSYKQIMMRLYGIVKNEKTIITKTNSLIKKNFIQRREDPQNKYGPPQYTINREVVQDKLDNLPALPSMKDVVKRYETKPVPVDGTPSIEDGNTDPYQQMVPPVPVDGTPRTSSYHSPVPADGSGGTSSGYTVKNSKNKENITETKEGITDTHTSLSSLSTDDLLAELQRRNALSQQVAESPQKVVPVPTNQPIIPNPNQNIPESPHNGAAVSTPSQGVTPSSIPKPAKPTRKRTPKEEPPTTKPEPPQMPAPDMAWSAQKCMMLFDAWRGAILIGRYKIAEAKTCAKGLAEQYTEEQVRAIYKAMNDLDYWKVRGGADICNVANNISKEIKKGKTVDEVARETPQPDTQIYWNTTGKKRCMDPDLWRWMPYEEAVKFGYTPELKPTEREVRDTETRKQMKRENEARKREQETAHG